MTIPTPGDRIRRKKSAKVQFASTTLMLEAFLIMFATLVAYGLRDIPSVWIVKEVPSAATIWTFGAILFVVLLLLSRMLHSPGGYLAGSLVQLPVLACGFAVPMMFGLAAVFLVLWFVALRLGAKIDRERAEYDAAHPETAPNV